MKKNPRNYKQNGVVYSYLLDAISSDEKEVENMTDKERLEYAFEMFYEEIFKHDKRKIYLYKKLVDWLQGLCSTVNVAFDYYSIEQIGYKWGRIKTERGRESFVENWWNMLAVAMLKLASLYHIDMSRFY